LTNASARVETVCYFDKNILKRREESDIYLTHVSGHCGSRQIMMKIDETGAFSQHCGFHQLMSTKAKSRHEPGSCCSIPFFLIYFYHFTS